MIGNEENFDRFEGDYKQYHITLELQSQTNSLKITVDSRESFDIYFTIIGLQQIKKDENFKNIFQEPVQILDYLAHNFQKLVVEQGQVRFDFVLGHIKQRVKTFVLKLEKAELISASAVNKKFQQFQAKLMEYFSIKEEYNNKEIKRLTEAERKYQRKIELVEQRQKIAINKLRISKKAEYLLEMRAKFTKSKLSDESIKQLEDSFKGKCIGLDLSCDKKLFKETKTTQFVNICSIGKSRWINFINKYPIFYENCRYTITLKDSGGGKVLIGFCTKVKQISKEPPFRNAFSAYYVSTGCLIKGGSYQRFVEELTVGGRIQCVISVPNKTIKWCLSNGAKQHVQMFEYEDEQPLFLSVIFENNGGSVDIIHEK